MLMHTLCAFRYDYRMMIILVIPEGYRPWNIVTSVVLPCHVVVHGGETRSIRCGTVGKYRMRRRWGFTMEPGLVTPSLIGCCSILL